MFHSVCGTTKYRKFNGSKVVKVDIEHKMRCRNTRRSSLSVISPSMDATLGRNHAAIASLLMVMVDEADIVVVVVFL